MTKTGIFALFFCAAGLCCLLAAHPAYLAYSAVPATMSESSDGSCLSKGTTPEECVRGFYQWYFEADKKDLAEKSDEIYRFVDTGTVKIAREHSGNMYYFTKVAVYSAQWDDVKTVVPDAVRITEDVYALKVEFRLDYRTFNVIAVVEKRYDGFFITKVMDVYPYEGK